jgi:Cu(I)/Ag(I) efflux system membrane protein CusA/SilA
LLTEVTTVVGLAPMLWATGTGAEIMQPMAAPVLGGILISDEVVDLLLPVLFYRVRRWRWNRIHGRREQPVVLAAGTPSPELAGV